MSVDNTRTVFVAGATGAIGRVLCTLRVDDGWRVFGTTRTSERAVMLTAIGVEPVIVDVFDRAALIDVVGDARPQVVVHQLTDLPQDASPGSMTAGRVRNARIREVGTEHLVAAAVAAGARHLVAQSVAFAYAAGGPQPFVETDALDVTTYASVAKLEELVFDSGIAVCVLRYGRLYGRRTWFTTPTGAAPLHVDAAAGAAWLAVARAATGVYNIAEDDGTVSSEKAKRELGWRADFRTM
jgi:nucleoside-diphosphate-sugar epimerase